MNYVAADYIFASSLLHPGPLRTRSKIGHLPIHAFCSFNCGPSLETIDLRVVTLSVSMQRWQKYCNGQRELVAPISMVSDRQVDGCLQPIQEDTY